MPSERTYKSRYQSNIDKAFENGPHEYVVGKVGKCKKCGMASNHFIHYGE